jgi:branched-chain amino acid transport system substrate-binding protein
MRLTVLILVAALSSSVASAAGGEPLKIAGSLDLSGPAASLGQEVLVGTQLAVELLNKKGGLLGRPITFDHQDNGTNVQKAVNQGTQLARDGAVFLMSPISSSSVIATTRAVSERFKIPMCVPTAASDQITMKEFQPYIFTVTPSLYMDMWAVAVRLAKQPYKRYAIVVPDYAGGRDAVRWFKGFLKEQNPAIEFVVEEYPKLGATDYTSTINKVLAAKPDYVWAQVYGSDLLTFAKQGTALGFFKQIDNHFMTVGDSNTLKQLGEHAPVGIEGYQFAPFAYFLSPRSSASPEAREWIAQYKAKTGDWPSDWAILAYDCVMSWAQAVMSAKSTDADAVMKVIETAEFSSVRGPFRFSPYDHQALIPVFLGKAAQSKEYGRALLQVDQVVPAEISHPSKEIVERYRKAN